MVALGVYRYGTSFMPKFLWESSFWGDPVGPPLCTNRSQKYIMHLSVKKLKLQLKLVVANTTSCSV